ncbi:MAG: putative metalloprotease CJM1_0395 family protein [Pseudomonadota bacterium]
MTTLGTLQTIPGSGGQLGQIVAVRSLPQTGNPSSQNASATGENVVPQPRPAAVSLQPLGSGPAFPGSTPVGDITAPTPLLGPGTVVTVIQQVDPRSLPDATPPGPHSTAEQQRNARKQLPENARPVAASPDLLTPREQEVARELSARDANVRAEEESYQALAGANAGMISYSYTAGPDGRLYASGGKVSIRALPGLEGMAAIANQAAISRAASVPGTSSADFNVAKGASRNISAMIATQAIAAAESYRAALGIGETTGTINIKS